MQIAPWFWWAIAIFQIIGKAGAVLKDGKACADIVALYRAWTANGDVHQDPPASYISRSIDLFRGFEKVEERIHQGHYSNQYDFDEDINDLISWANDGHLQICLAPRRSTDSGVKATAISISEGINNEASPVVKINGLDARYYLESRIGFRIGLQDPDARYNRMFPSASAGLAGSYPGGAWTRYRGLWPGAAVHKLQLANETEITVETTASWPAINGPMHYTSGEDLFNAACLPGPDSAIGSSPGRYQDGVNEQVAVFGAGLFLKPEVKSQHDDFRGYFLESPTLNDTAVLKIPSFRVRGDAADFARTAEQFILKTAAMGKSKLIIDLSSNAGGDVSAGFNLFRLLFPDVRIASATRFRATELVNLMGQVFSQTYDRDQTILDPPLVVEQAVSIDQQHEFRLWKDLYGPDMVLGDEMSRPYSHFDLNLASSATNPICGYVKAPLRPDRRLFEPQNIVIMTDGHCASTCALVVELMRDQGVRTIAFGGRPRKGPMQAVGGVKGGQYWSLSTISNHVTTAYELALNASRTDSPILNDEELRRFRELMPLPLEEFPLRFDVHGDSSVNFRDAYAPDDLDTPLQFAYDAADCRLFYTIENYLNPASTWVAAANAMSGQMPCA